MVKDYAKRGMFRTVKVSILRRAGARKAGKRARTRKKCEKGFFKKACNTIVFGLSL